MVDLTTDGMGEEARSLTEYARLQTELSIKRSNSFALERAILSTITNLEQTVNSLKRELEYAEQQVKEVQKKLKLQFPQFMPEEDEYHA